MTKGMKYDKCLGALIGVALASGLVSYQQLASAAAPPSGWEFEATWIYDALGNTVSTELTGSIDYYFDCPGGWQRTTTTESTLDPTHTLRIRGNTSAVHSMRIEQKDSVITTWDDQCAQGSRIDIPSYPPPEGTGCSPIGPNFGLFGGTCTFSCTAFESYYGTITGLYVSINAKCGNGAKVECGPSLLGCTTGNGISSVNANNGACNSSGLVIVGDQCNA